MQFDRESGSGALCKSGQKLYQKPHVLISRCSRVEYPEKVSLRWVKHLYGLVDELNDTETEMIGMKPKDAIKLKEVPLVNQEAYPPEEVLPKDRLYQYLLQPGEEHDGQRCRATDRIWSEASYRLREIAENPGYRVIYYLLNGPERAFVSEELMLIPEDTELPPDYVQQWEGLPLNIYPTG